MKFRIACLLLSILFLVSCGSILPAFREQLVSCRSIPPASREQSIKHYDRQYHTWTGLSENQSLNKDYALYSYVLVKNERSMDHFFGIKDVDGDTRTANIIRDNYDFDYTKKICNYLLKASDHLKIQKILKEESGPFIVSILKPISIDKLDKDTNILLLNCSNLNDAIIPLVVDRYIKYVEKNEISEDKIIRNLSIFLGDGITDLNDCLFSFMIVLDAIESKT